MNRSLRLGTPVNAVFHVLWQHQQDSSEFCDGYIQLRHYGLCLQCRLVLSIVYYSAAYVQDESND
jgi:hypothetical protein